MLDDFTHSVHSVYMPFKLQFCHSVRAKRHARSVLHVGLFHGLCVFDDKLKHKSQSQGRRFVDVIKL